MSFSISSFHGSTIWRLYRIRDRIQLDPDYQRLGGIWGLETKQLLLDTILNGFDVPKLYMHKFSTPLEKGGKTYDFAIVDGRQRLETLWSFIDGKLPLADDFKFFRDDTMQAKGMTYEDLGKEHPDVKADFDAYPLSVIQIETDDLEMIEEMFSRLNEAAPLTAPEKRNAYSGPLPGAIRRLAKEHFFTQALPFQNRRYRHYDLATKFLLFEYEGKVVDTKKARLDAFVEAFEAQSRTKPLPFFKAAQHTVQTMSKVFTMNDALLRQVGMVTLYYHLFRFARDNDWAEQITRQSLVKFNELRSHNKMNFELGFGDEVDKELLEFDNFAQSPNDAGALRFRLSVLLKRGFGVPEDAFELDDL